MQTVKELKQKGVKNIHNEKKMFFDIEKVVLHNDGVHHKKLWVFNVPINIDRMFWDNPVYYVHKHVARWIDEQDKISAEDLISIRNVRKSTGTGMSSFKREPLKPLPNNYVDEEKPGDYVSDLDKLTTDEINKTLEQKGKAQLATMRDIEEIRGDKTKKEDGTTDNDDPQDDE